MFKTKLAMNIFTLLSVLLIGLSLAKADTQPVPTHAKELQAKFDAAAESLTVQDLMGAYLGRCYTNASDNPEGMILTTVSQQEGANQGPLFPSTTSNKLSMIESDTNTSGVITVDPSSSNDSVTQSAIDNFWANPTVNDDGTLYDSQVADLQFEQNTALSVTSLSETSDGKTIHGHAYIRVRKGADGYFYARQGQDSDATGTVVGSNVNDDEYCYFWQKLTPQ
jgi:hypothetical protein